jgi:hypothetical protein
MTPLGAGTGNNVMLKGDAHRRVMYCRLKSSEENPEYRQDFVYPNLLAHIRDNRGKLLAAGLTILRGFCVAGRPDQGIKPWGSYEAWSALVRNAVVWAGQQDNEDLPDPGESRLELRRLTQQSFDALPALSDGLERMDPSGQGVTVQRMLAEGKNSEDEVVKAMYAAICTLCPGKDGAPHASPKSIGMKLFHMRDKVVGGRRLERDDDQGHKGYGTLWRVVAGGTRGK